MVINFVQSSGVQTWPRCVGKGLKRDIKGGWKKTRRCWIWTETEQSRKNYTCIQLYSGDADGDHKLTSVLITTWINEKQWPIKHQLESIHLMLDKALWKTGEVAWFHMWTYGTKKQAWIVGGLIIPQITPNELWLVVSTPLKNISLIPYIMENKKCSKPPTRTYWSGLFLLKFRWPLPESEHWHERCCKNQIPNTWTHDKGRTAHRFVPLMLYRS